MAAPGDRLWLAVSESMKEGWRGSAVASICGGGARQGFGCITSSVRSMGQIGRKCIGSSSLTHDEPTLVEQEAHAVYKHLDWKGFFAVHKVADQNEEQNEDVQVEW